MDFSSTSPPAGDPLSSIFVPDVNTSNAFNHGTNVGKDTQPQQFVGSGIPAYVEGLNDQATWNNDLSSAHSVHNSGLILDGQLASPMPGPWNNHNLVDTLLRSYDGGMHLFHHDQAFGNSSIPFGNGTLPASTSRESSVSSWSSGSSRSTSSLMTPHWTQAPSLQTPFLQQHALFMNTPIPDVQQPQMANSFMGSAMTRTQPISLPVPMQAQNIPELQFRYYKHDNTLDNVTLPEPIAARSGAAGVGIDNSSPIPLMSTSSTPQSQAAGPSSAREKAKSKGKEKVDDSKKTENIGPIRSKKRKSPNSTVPCKDPTCDKLFFCKKTMLRHVTSRHDKEKRLFCPGLHAVRDDSMRKCTHASGYAREDSLKRHLDSAKENDPCRIEAKKLGWNPAVPGSIQRLKKYRPSNSNGEMAENI
ncbi:uncharacterized protein FOMMEDRAFT_30269 [Fomitiporia mediterranea MF3/22]|uniref:uncharacterized protein n=1 Tax=Fomitiporia mediterranea (strain MF3/22) TaxID=694068 RepID=UPI0004409AF1|nr:uncharacterized protein FOMMEDRAFT_30269 [Fomitiporia mediterranea MF3/22]EJD01625.1 hypothetical protein FOMMEDRAFT_30269 [Fomitiporia mediterranea MF3/22]